MKREIHLEQLHGTLRYTTGKDRGKEFKTIIKMTKNHAFYHALAIK